MQFTLSLRGIVPLQALRLTIAFVACLLLGACNRGAESHQHEHEHQHGSTAAESAEDVAVGAHGGRLLRDGDFAIEVTIFERDRPPEFRLYPSDQGKALKPDQVQATIELQRINGLPGGGEDQHRFTAKDDYLLSPVEVQEPHSFSVSVSASHAGKTHRWNYESPEGQVRIAADMAAASGLQTGVAGPGQLHETLRLFGNVRPNPQGMRRVNARFPGVVRSVSAQLGDTVQRNQQLATVESNESLQLYSLSAPIAGVITARHINAGESTGSEALFEITDFSSLQAELNVFPRDRSRLQPGQSVIVSAADGGARSEGRIDSISPLGNDHQALSARVWLDNAQGQWTPGQFLSASVRLGEQAAALLVPASALQKFRDWDVVFVVDGDRYQAQPVQLGRRDDTQVEVLGGLAAGARIVTGNSYLVKADIEKSGAEHDH